MRWEMFHLHPFGRRRVVVDGVRCRKLQPTLAGCLPSGLTPKSNAMFSPHENWTDYKTVSCGGNVCVLVAVAAVLVVHTTLEIPLVPPNIFLPPIFVREHVKQPQERQPKQPKTRREDTILEAETRSDFSLALRPVAQKGVAVLVFLHVTVSKQLTSGCQATGHEQENEAMRRIRVHLTKIGGKCDDDCNTRHNQRKRRYV